MSRVGVNYILEEKLVYVSLIEQGVFKQLGVDIIPLPSDEVDIDYTHVPKFLKNVFYCKWWDIDEHKSIKLIKKIISQ